MQFLYIFLNICFLILNIIFGTFISSKLAEKSNLVNQLKAKEDAEKSKFDNYKTKIAQSQDLFNLFSQGGKILSYTRDEKSLGQQDGKKYGAAQATYFLHTDYLTCLSKLQYINDNNLAFAIKDLVIDSKNSLALSIYIKFIILTYEEN